MSREEWLKTLKAGDEVDCGQQIKRVERVTPTQIVIGKGNQEIRFDRQEGRQRGGNSYRRLWLHQVTPELRAKYEHRDLAMWLRYLQHEKLTLAQLRAIKAVIEGAPK